MTRKITANMEDYLEAIHVLAQDRGNVRVKDIAQVLNVTMPSVSGAVKKMEKQGLVSHPKYDTIVLTARGSVMAEEIYRRHRIIKSFLENVLGLDPDIAEQDACRIEHNISPETLAGLKRFME
ncbi:metal-dependent transcriptional regulator [bacterium]|nr:metal-dependent transcriptional regulator [bacterium]